MANCLARQQSDQMYCAPCDLRWDVNDFDPPKCRPNGQASAARGAPSPAPGHMPVVGPDERAPGAAPHG